MLNTRFKQLTDYLKCIPLYVLNAFYLYCTAVSKYTVKAIIISSFTQAKFIPNTVVFTTI